MARIKKALKKHKKMVDDLVANAIRIESDVYGNPRYYQSIVSFCDENGKFYRPFNANSYRGKRYGSGWTFQSYNLRRTMEQAIEEQYSVKFE